MNRAYRPILAATVIGIVVGCARSATDPRAAIDLQTEISPSVVAVGDTVTIRAIMRNATPWTVQPSLGCGPPVFFELRATDGAVIYPMPLSGIYTCPFSDYHELSPHETDTLVMRWRVQADRGQWEVRSGFNGGAGLRRASLPVRLTVE